MTRHLSALIREDLATVGVVFSLHKPVSEQNIYTYKVLKADLSNYAVGDWLAVPANKDRDGFDRYALVALAEIHDVPKIDLDADFDYKWVINKVDRGRYLQVLAHEEQFNKLLQDAEIQRARAGVIAQFRKQFEEIPGFADRLNNLKLL